MPSDAASCGLPRIMKAFIWQLPSWLLAVWLQWQWFLNFAGLEDPVTSHLSFRVAHRENRAF